MLSTSRRSLWRSASLFLGSLFTLSQAATIPFDSFTIDGDSGSTLTVAVNVPQNSTDSLFFQFSAPAGQAWAGFGFGSSMSGALMFVVYAAEDGKNVTVSSRLGKGHVMPQNTDDVTMQFFDGTAIVDDVYHVNAMCTGCRSWNGGSLDVTNTGQVMLWAVGPARPTIKSNNLLESIHQHSSFGTFALDLKKATGVGGLPGPALTNTTTSDSGAGSDDDSQRGGADRFDRFRGGVAFHAVLMILAFLIVFPAGYLFLRVFEKVWIHIGLQSFALLCVMVSSGVGIAISKRDKISPSLTAPHQIIGILVMILVVAAWSIGMTGHQIYKKTGQPAKIMLAHRILGPSTMGLGLINACVGFNFAGESRRIIGFAVLTVLMCIIVSGVLFMKRRRQMRKNALNTPAAMNFRDGQMAGEAGQGPPGYQQQSIPLQSYSDGNGGGRPPVYR